MHLASTQWPHFYVHQRLNDRSPSPARAWEPLIADGQPYFPSLNAALAEVIYGVAPSMLQNPSAGTLLTQLPDTRARIASIGARDGEVIASIETDAGARDTLTLRAAWRTSAADASFSQHSVAIVGRAETTLPTAGVPAQMSVALLDGSGCLLDQRGWSEHDGQQPTDDADLGGLLARWLAEGEGTAVEFKQDLKGDPVRRSFAETVAAFANGGGGVILVGVADDGTIVGYRPPKASEQITSLARDLVTEPVTVRTVEIVVDAKHVQVVWVPPGDQSRKPYRCRDRVMVRANATTRAASTFEIRALSAQPQAAQPVLRPR